MAYPVKNFSSAMAGAPVLSGAAGSLIALLDACLVNGFNLITLDSLVVAGGVLTGTKAGHGFVVDQVVSTTAAEPALTGDWLVTSVTSNTFSAVAAGVQNTSGTGSLTAKTSSGGWSKMFSGTNKGVYKSTDPTATGMCLRVDDTGTTTARVVGYESMTDVDTGSGIFPTSVQVAGGGYWAKSSTADSVARSWVLIADSAGFYLIVFTAIGASNFGAFFDFGSTKPGDAYRCALACKNSTSNLTNYGYTSIAQQAFQAVGDGSLYAPRSYTQIGSSVSMTCGFLGLNNVPSGTSTGLAYPSGPGNGLLVTPIAMKEDLLKQLRATSVPGIYATPQALPLTHGDKVSNVSGLPGKKLMALTVAGASSEGRLFVDLVGPWR